MPGIFWVSLISYLLSLGCAFVEALMPAGEFFENLIVFLYFAFTATGAITAGILNDLDRDWEQEISDEEYDKLYQMILERKKQLAGENS